MCAPHVVLVDVAREERDAERHLRRKPRPDRARQIGLLLHDVHHLRQDLVEDRHAAERLRDLAVAAADEDDAAHFVGPPPIVLEHDLRPHRVPEQHARGIAQVVPHALEVARVRVDADARRVDGRPTPPVSPVMPMRDVTDRREVVP
jgi:hypothetical protein